jgi:hypothetical protein
MALLKIYTDENAARGRSARTVALSTKLPSSLASPRDRGVYKCRPYQKPFSVTVGTVFERSKIKLNTWVHAVDLNTEFKKGFSAHQLHRTLGLTYRPLGSWRCVFAKP